MSWNRWPLLWAPRKEPKGPSQLFLFFLKIWVRVTSPLCWSFLLKFWQYWEVYCPVSFLILWKILCGLLGDYPFDSQNWYFYQYLWHFFRKEDVQATVDSAWFLPSWYFLLLRALPPQQWRKALSEKTSYCFHFPQLCCTKYCLLCRSHEDGSFLLLVSCDLSTPLKHFQGLSLYRYSCSVHHE